MDEDLIAQAICNFYKEKFTNAYEKFAISLFDDAIILIATIEKITPIDIKSSLPYGLIQAED